MRESSEEEMEEVEELASNRLLDSLIEISSVGGISMREENEDLTASATMIVVGEVVNVVMIVRMMVVTVGGKVGELTGEEKPIGRQVGGRENHSSNRLTLRQRKKGDRKGPQAKPAHQASLRSRGLWT